MDTSAPVREKSKPGTAFPYYDLEQAATLCKLLHEMGGSGSLDQLAGKAGQTPQSGAFRMRLSAAQQFGFLERDRDRYRLGECGVLLHQPNRVAQAKVSALLRVPLYRRIYQEFKGRMMPPPQGIENFMRNSGVVAGQSDRARQIFQRSADQAGFFQFGSDRLVLPPGTSEDGYAQTDEPSSENRRPDDLPDVASTALPPKASGLHPAIEGMLQELPAKGETWTEDDLKAWADAFLGVLRVVHRPMPKMKAAGDSGVFD